MSPRPICLGQSALQRKTLSQQSNKRANKHEAGRWYAGTRRERQSWHGGLSVHVAVLSVGVTPVPRQRDAEGFDSGTLRNPQQTCIYENRSLHVKTPQSHSILCSPWICRTAGVVLPETATAPLCRKKGPLLCVPWAPRVQSKAVPP